MLFVAAPTVRIVLRFHFFFRSGQKIYLWIIFRWNRLLRPSFRFPCDTATRDNS